MSTYECEDLEAPPSTVEASSRMHSKASATRLGLSSSQVSATCLGSSISQASGTRLGSSNSQASMRRLGSADSQMFSMRHIPAIGSNRDDEGKLKVYEAAQEWLRLGIATVIVAGVLVATIAAQIIIQPPPTCFTETQDCKSSADLATWSFFLSLITIVVGSCLMMFMAVLLRGEKLDKVDMTVFTFTGTTLFFFTLSVTLLGFAVMDVYTVRFPDRTNKLATAWPFVIVALMGFASTTCMWLGYFTGVAQEDFINHLIEFKDYVLEKLSRKRQNSSMCCCCKHAVADAYDDGSNLRKESTCSEQDADTFDASIELELG